MCWVGDYGLRYCFRLKMNKKVQIDLDEIVTSDANSLAKEKYSIILVKAKNGSNCTHTRYSLLTSGEVSSSFLSWECCSKIFGLTRAPHTRPSREKPGKKNKKPDQFINPIWKLWLYFSFFSKCSIHSCYEINAFIGRCSIENFATNVLVNESHYESNIMLKHYTCISNIIFL